MNNIFKLYSEEYFTAMRIANILYRPAMDDSQVIVTEDLWKNGEPIIVKRNDGVHMIYKR